MSDITFNVAGLPIAQPRQRHAVRMINGEPVSRNYTPSASPVAAYKAACTLVASQHCDKPLEGPVALWLTFIFPRPQSRTRKRGPNPRLWKTTKPDLDNLVKSFCDALNGVAWRDDAQVAWCCVQKLEGEPGEAARVEVRIVSVYDMRGGGSCAMTNDDFRRLVADMRHAQKEYFRTRSNSALEASKRLERAVDKALLDNGQKKLFEEGEDDDSRDN